MNKNIIAQIIRQNIIAIGRIRNNPIRITPRSKITRDLGLQESDISKILMTTFPIGDMMPSKKICRSLPHQKHLTVKEFCRLVTENLIPHDCHSGKKTHAAVWSNPLSCFNKNSNYF